MAFAEQGVAMLSSVLNSNTAINANIQIIRIFTRMRQLLLNHKDILLKIEQIERKITDHDGKVELLFEYIKRLLQEKLKSRKRIGYKIKGEE